MAELATIVSAGKPTDDVQADYDALVLRMAQGDPKFSDQPKLKIVFAGGIPKQLAADVEAMKVRIKSEGAESID